MTKANKLLLRALEANPAMDAKAFSQLVGSSEEAVRKRLRRLRSQGLIFDVPFVDSSVSEFKHRAVASLTIDRPALSEPGPHRFDDYDGLVRFFFHDLLKTKDWALAKSRHPNADVKIEAVYSVQGNVDVVIIIAATDISIIATLVGEVIDKMRVVRRSVTFNVTEVEMCPVSLRSKKSNADRNHELLKTKAGWQN